LLIRFAFVTVPIVPLINGFTKGNWPLGLEAVFIPNPYPNPNPIPYSFSIPFWLGLR
jgi:hypothetical protein